MQEQTAACGCGLQASHQDEYISLPEAKLPDGLLEGFIDGHFCSRRSLHPSLTASPSSAGKHLSHYILCARCYSLDVNDAAIYLPMLSYHLGWLARSETGSYAACSCLRAWNSVLCNRR